MPNIATGAKSALAYKEELTFNTAPSGNWTGVTFENETFGESIPRVMSNEIRPTRTVPAIRGGNIGAGGNVTADLSVDRYGIFLKHLLAATPVTTSTGLYATGSLVSNNTNAANNDTVVIGTKTYTFKTALTPAEGEILIGADADASLANLVSAINHTGTPDTDYKCAAAHSSVTASPAITAHTVVVTAIAAGTASNSIATTTPVGATLDWDDVTLVDGANTGGAYTVSALTTATYKRGTVVSSNSKYFLTTDTGVVSSVGGGLTVSSGTQTLGTATFEYLGATSTPIYQHVLPGGVNFPTGGISMEKKLTGSSSTYALFTGGRINSLDITVRQEAIVQTAWAFLFVQPSTSGSTAAGTPNYSVEDPSMSYESWITLGTDGTCRPATDITLKVMNNLDDKVYTVDSRIRREIPSGRRECSGNFTVFFEDSTELDAFTAETESEMTVSFNRNGEYLAFVMGETKLNGDGTPKISGPGVIKASFDYMAFQQDGDTDITATMISLEPTLR